MLWKIAVLQLSELWDMSSQLQVINSLQFWYFMLYIMVTFCLNRLCDHRFVCIYYLLTLSVLCRHTWPKDFSDVLNFLRSKDKAQDVYSHLHFTLKDILPGAHVCGPEKEASSFVWNQGYGQRYPHPSSLQNNRAGTELTTHTRAQYASFTRRTGTQPEFHFVNYDSPLRAASLQ